MRVSQQVAAGVPEPERARSELPPGVWVVVPAFNEARVLGGVLDELATLVQNIVVIDDGSTDDTSRVALERPVWLVSHPLNLGQGAALQTGVEFALAQSASHIVTFDADGQHCASDILTLLTALGEGEADFVLGSRFLGAAEGIPRSRKLLLRLGILFTRAFSGVWLSDTHNGLKAMTRRGAETVRLTFNGMEHASELLDQIARSGLRSVEAPVRIRYTSHSIGKGQRTSAALGLGLRLLLSRVTR
jgi:glycosyltransferase involved in cell wall biosynthesis